MKKIRTFTTFVLTLSLSLFNNVFLSAANSSASKDILEQGVNAYRMRDWNSATIFLRRAIENDEYSTADNWYLLVMSQMYGGDYTSVIKDSNSFNKLFPESSLNPYIQYQKGRALHFLGYNDNAVLTLSDFCRQNPESPVYGSALFWIGECFFEDFNYETAKALYESVIYEYPESSSVQEAKFRLEIIAQNEREEKLLYLLKMAGEEYLSAKEHYERQLRIYRTEDLEGLRKQLNASNERIKELERIAAANAASAAQAASAANTSSNSKSSATSNTSEDDSAVIPIIDGENITEIYNEQDELESLRIKADLLQHMLDDKTGGM